MNGIVSSAAARSQLTTASFERERATTARSLENLEMLCRARKFCGRQEPHWGAGARGNAGKSRGRQAQSARKAGEIVQFGKGSSCFLVATEYHSAFMGRAAATALGACTWGDSSGARDI